MKLFILIALLCSSASFAQEQIAAPTIIAEAATTSVGEGPWWKVSTQVFSNGEVKKTRQSRQGTATHSALTLDAAIVDSYKRKIEAIKSGELVSPEEPGCRDAPNTNYSITKSSGENISIGRHQACVDYHLADGQGKGLVEALKALDAIEELF